MLTFFFLIFFSLNSYCEEVRSDIQINVHGWPEKLIQTKQIITLLCVTRIKNHTAPLSRSSLHRINDKLEEERRDHACRKIFLSTFLEGIVE